MTLPAEEFSSTKVFHAYLREDDSVPSLELPQQSRPLASEFPATNRWHRPAQTTGTQERYISGRNPPDCRLRAIIAVSNPVSRCGLESMLRESSDVTQVSMTSDAGEAADDVRKERFDLVIASTDMVLDESPELLKATRAAGMTSSGRRGPARTDTSSRRN